MSGRYRTIVVDPPWTYTKQIGVNGGTGPWPERDYPTMTCEEIAALPVGELADVDAHVYIWTTNVMMTRQRWGWPDAVEICKLWGFEPKTILTWVKGSIGLGRYFRGQTEHVIFAVRGAVPIEGTRRESNVFHAPRGRHSEKPDCFYDLVERVSPPPFAELFARRARFGWDYPIGNEALGGATAGVTS